MGVVYLFMYLALTMIICVEWGKVLLYLGLGIWTEPLKKIYLLDHEKEKQRENKVANTGLRFPLLQIPFPLLWLKMAGTPFTASSVARDGHVSHKMT